MMAFNSIEEWRDYCFNAHSLYFKNQHFKKWINEKEIHIFNFSGLKENNIKHIKLGMEDAVKTARLHFKVYYNNDGSKKVINLKEEEMDSKSLLKIIIKKRKENHKENARIFLFSKPIKSPSAVIKDGEGLTYVTKGITIFSFDTFKKYPYNFLRRRAKHEALHLLGLNFHHEDTKVKGYKYDMKCNMNYNAPTTNLCQKCKDALVYFWRGIDYATKK